MPVTLTYPGVYVEEIAQRRSHHHRRGDLNHSVCRARQTWTDGHRWTDRNQQLW